MTKQDGAGLKAEMLEIKAEIIKWMFLFWLGQMAVTAGIVKLLG